MWQEREPQSDWHEEREKASNDFRKLVEEHPKDVRKVVGAFKRIEKVSLPFFLCYSLIKFVLKADMMSPIEVCQKFRCLHNLSTGSCSCLRFTVLV